MMKLINMSLEVAKGACVVLCGPIVLTELILCGVYYEDILNGCQDSIEDPVTSTLVYLIIVLGCISIATTCYCFYLSFLLCKSVKKVMPILRDPSLGI